jgi:hypothetical protein
MNQDNYRYRYTSDATDEEATRDVPAQDADPSEKNRQTMVRGLPAEGNGPNSRDAGQQGGGRQTIVRSGPVAPSRPVISGVERDDRTRVRVPTVGGGRGRGPSGNDDSTRHVRRERSGRSPRRAATVRMQSHTGLFGWLIVKEGTRVGHVYELDPEVTDLGRGPTNHIVVDDDRVSDQHTRIRVEDDQFVVWDLASTNGTFVNGQRITAATPIVENDEVQIGHSIMVLKTLDLRK